MRSVSTLLTLVGALLGTLCMPVHAAVAASGPHTHASPGLANAYRLGIATYSAQAAVIALDETIQKSKPTVAQMADLAQRTRTGELADYHAAVLILRRMGAPIEVETSYVDAVSTLDAPVAVGAAVARRFPRDPRAQQVWATLNEADHIGPNEAAQLGPWLSLSLGQPGLWAYHLGCLMAAVEARIPGDPATWPLISTAGTLAASAPPSTPAGLTTALQIISAHAARGRVYVADVQALETAGGDAFGPTAIAAGPNPPAGR